MHYLLYVNTGSEIMHFEDKLWDLFLHVMKDQKTRHTDTRYTTFSSAILFNDLFLSKLRLLPKT